MSDSIKGILIAAGVILGVGLLAGFAATSSQSQTKDSNKIQTNEVSSKNKDRVETLKETETIPHETQTVEDATVEYGQQVVRTNGQNGTKTRTYKVTYKDDKEVGRELVGEEITRQPVTEVIAQGTKIVWHCVDATSYDRNPYNDNKCTSSTGEVRYVSDSQSRALDPSYSPGQAGPTYYNSF